jgi:predicted metal-dependent HD superfamily phosphohydrolase
MSLISDTIRADLVRTCMAPDQHFHGLAHIKAMLRLVNRFAADWSDYAFMPDRLRTDGRRKVLEAFAQPPAIHPSPQFRRTHEASARHNLARSLATAGPIADQRSLPND